MRVTVKTSLTAMVVVLVAFLLGQGWMAVSKLQAMRSATTEISDNWLPSVKVLGDVKYQVTRYRAQSIRYAMISDPAARTEQEQRMGATAAEAGKLIMRYEPMISGAEERRLWTEFKSDWNNYLAFQDKIFVLSRSGETEQVAKLLKETIAAFDTMIAVLDKGVDLNDKGAHEATSLAEATYDGAFLAVMAFGMVSVLVGVGAGVFVVFGVSSPLDRLTLAMQKIAGGDLAAEIPSAERRNEIGDMARSLLVFRDGLAEAERLRAAQAEKEAEQARRLEAERHRIADRFMATMGSLAQSFVTSSGEVAEAARNLSATAEETARQAQSVAQAAEDASSNVQTVAASTEELAASVREINDQVVHSSSIASVAADEAASTETNIRSLSEAAEKIGDVVNLIRDIAGQTNLLALNATIEAARAGEAGKGFAVVASEVKQLAAQTAKATDEIAEKIGEIQAATGDTVASISRIVGTIGSIREVTASIAGAVTEQGAATDEISGNTHRAAQGAAQVTDNISGVGQAAEMTGSAATQLMGLSDGLSSQADRLTVEVDDFVRTLRSA